MNFPSPCLKSFFAVIDFWRDLIILIHQIIVLFVLMFINSWSTAISTALRVLDLKKAKYISETTDKETEEKLTSALDKIENYTNTASVVTAVTGILTGMVLGFFIIDRIIFAFTQAEEYTVLDKAEPIIFLLIYIYLFAFVSIVLPKFLADRFPDTLVLKGLWFIKFFEVLLMPIVCIVNVSYAIIEKLFGDTGTDNEEVSEGEILMMVDAGGESGGIDEIEKEMINNIFDFDDKIVGEIATHRKDIVGIEINSGLDDIIQTITAEKYSRLPVYEENIDNIVGVLNTKDLMTTLIVKGSEGFDLKSLLREPEYVPFNKKTDELFSEMQSNKFHMAIIVDEYGGTAGIVTMEDLIEEIMGNIQDEYDEEELPEISVLEDNSILIDGKTSLEDVAEELEIELPTEEYDTLGGFIVGQMGHIPDEYEDIVIDYGDYTFFVEKIEDKRIVMVKAVKKTEQPKENTDE